MFLLPHRTSRKQIIPSNSTLVERQVNAYEQLNLTPRQMQVLKRINLETERQKASPYINLPTPVVRSLAVSLEPGKTPPVNSYVSQYADYDKQLYRCKW